MTARLSGRVAVFSSSSSSFFCRYVSLTEIICIFHLVFSLVSSLLRTDPFIEPSQACSLFQIILNLFVRYDTGGGGKVRTLSFSKQMPSKHKKGRTLVHESSSLFDALSCHRCLFFFGIEQLCLLDEAHKYLGDKGGGAKFTETLLSCVRQQRHFGLRTSDLSLPSGLVMLSFCAYFSMVGWAFRVWMMNL